MKERFQLEPGIALDWRRALWLEPERTLVVADLHLGYAWAHRHAGQLLPLSRPDTELDRLLQLQAEYKPDQLVFLGDIVHRAVPVKELGNILCGMSAELESRSRLVWIAGNHDRNLSRLAAGMDRPIVLKTHLQIGRYLLVHGDQSAESIPPGCEPALTIVGHEHPAVMIGDGVATSAKCPCFLVADSLIILPAFSEWVAGTVLGRHDFMSALARRARFKTAYAIVGQNLLPLKLG